MSTATTQTAAAAAQASTATRAGDVAQAADAKTTAKATIGAKMIELAERDERVVAVNADLTRSSSLDEFAERFPSRCFNVGIAEQQMVSFAAGLAAEGFMPFCFTFGPFLSMRAIEQIRTDVCYPNLPVRFVGANAGYSAGVMGATHCALEDVGILCSISNMTLAEGADPYDAAQILEASLALDGPLYLRTNREPQARVLPADAPFEFGRARVLREGDDGALLVSGVCVEAALAAARALEDARGARVRVVDLASVRPLDEAAILDAVATGRVVVAQDANVHGGLGYQVAAVMAQTGVSCKFRMLGCPDRFVPIATPPYLYHVNGYDAEGLERAMAELLG